MPFLVDNKISELFRFVFNIPPMQQPEVLALCERLDKINMECVRAILSSGSLFPLRVFSKTYVEVAAGITHGRVVYERDPKLNADEMKGPFRSDAEIEFLCRTLPIIRNTRGRINVAKAIEAIENAKFIRAVFEESIMLFLEITKEYQALCWQASNLINSIHFLDKKNASATATELAETLDAIERISDFLDVKENLYSLITFVKLKYVEYNKIKENILKSYLRIPLALAKTKATDSTKLLDHFQNGSEGLLQAISYYSNSMSNFSSYAKLWAKQAILYKIKEEGNALRLPPNIWQAFTAIEKNKSKIATKRGKTKIKELSKITGIQSNRIKEIYEHVRSCQMMSLDSTLEGSDSNTLYDVVGVHENYDNVDNKQMIQSKFVNLDPEARFVMALHFGLFDFLPDSKIDKEEKLLGLVNQLAARLKSCK